MSNVMNELLTIFSTWHVIRAAGLTAYLLLFLTTTVGLLLSLRIIPGKDRLAVINVHKTIAMTGLVFALLHLSALLFETHIHFSLADVFIPFWSSYQTRNTALGVIVFYAMAIVILISIPVIMKKMGYRIWRSIHSFAFLCYWIALYHGVVLGTDSHNGLVLMMYIFTGLIVVSLISIKVKKTIQGRGSRFAHSARGR